MKLKKSVSLILLASSPCALFYKGHCLLFSPVDIDLSPLHASEKLILENIDSFNENRFAINESNSHLNSLIKDNKNFESSFRVVKGDKTKEVSLFIVKEKKKPSKAIELLDSISLEKENYKVVSQVKEAKKVSYKEYKFSFENDGHELVEKNSEKNLVTEIKNLRSNDLKKISYSAIEKKYSPLSNLNHDKRYSEKFYFGKLSPIQEKAKDLELDNSELVSLKNKNQAIFQNNFLLESNIKFKPVQNLKPSKIVSTQKVLDGKKVLSSQPESLKFIKGEAKLVLNDDHDLKLKENEAIGAISSRVQEEKVKGPRVITFTTVDKKADDLEGLTPIKSSQEILYKGKMNEIKIVDALEVDNFNLALDKKRIKVSLKNNLKLEKDIKLVSIIEEQNLTTQPNSTIEKVGTLEFKKGNTEIVSKVKNTLNKNLVNDSEQNESSILFKKGDVKLSFDDGHDLILKSSSLGKVKSVNLIDNENEGLSFKTGSRNISFLKIEKEVAFDSETAKDVEKDEKHYLGTMGSLENITSSIEIDNSDLVDLTGFDKIQSDKGNLRVAEVLESFKVESFLADLEEKSLKIEEEKKARLLAESKVFELKKSELILGKVGSQGNAQVEGFKNDEEQIQDYVKTLQASNTDSEEESRSIAQLVADEPKNSEMVFMDLDEEPSNETAIDTPDISNTDVASSDFEDVTGSTPPVVARQMGIHMAANPDRIPTSVSKVIDRELKKRFNSDYPIKNAPRVSNVDIQKNVRNFPSKLSGYSKSSGYSKFFKKRKAVKRDRSISLDLLGTQVAIDKGFKDDLINFDFIPEFDKNTLVSSNSEGVIEIDSNLNNKFGVLRGTIVERGIVRTKVDISLKNGKESINVPLLTVEDFEGFLQKENLNAIGGTLLLELDDKVEDVDIDKPFEAKIFLNEEFKAVFNNTWKYIMFIGVAPGNALVSFKSGDNLYSEKIVQISQDEILYNQISLQSGGLKKISLSERNTMGKVNSDLNFGGENLAYFNTKNKGTRIGLNSYEFLRPPIPQGTREYLELTHLKEPIFLGKWDQRKAEIPSNRFISEVLGFFDVDQLEGMCIVQINLEKEASEIFIEGDTGSNSLHFRPLYLDKDGLISEEINEMSNKVFILGEGQGMFNLKIKYLDHTEDYLQTFCSNGTYLVEQL